MTCELAFKEQHNSVGIGTAEEMGSTTVAVIFQVWEINFSLLQSLKNLGLIQPPNQSVPTASSGGVKTPSPEADKSFFPSPDVKKV
jgi:hypothetical protein